MGFFYLICPDMVQNRGKETLQGFKRGCKLLFLKGLTCLGEKVLGRIGVGAGGIYEKAKLSNYVQNQYAVFFRCLFAEDSLKTKK